MATERGTGNDQFQTLRQASSGALTPSTRIECDLRIAARAATALFNCYPRNEANNPEVFLAGATAMLNTYPEAVVIAVCDPVRGLPSTNKFLPAISEIREACEKEMIWHDAVVRREARRAETAKVLGDVRAAPVGTTEHKRVLKGFAELGEAMAAREPVDPRPKPFTLPVHEERPLYADKPIVVTPAMREYLGKWIEP
jgi:hypothetical protein